MLPELTLRVRERRERRWVYGVVEGILTMMALKLLEKARMKSTDNAILKIQFFKTNRRTPKPLFRSSLDLGGENNL